MVFMRYLSLSILFTLIFHPVLSQRAFAKDRLKVAVTILPEKFFVEKIGGSLVEVEVMVPPGANPVSYEPKASQMRVLSKASIYFSIGVPVEKTWLKRFMELNPGMIVVPLYEGIQRIPISGHNHKNHTEGFMDPHVWLSPPLTFIMARNVAYALVEKLPGNAKYLFENYQKLIRDIARIDSEIMDIFQRVKRKRKGPFAFMVFHPSWGYFARSYGLLQLPIEIEGKEMKPGRLLELASKAKKLSIQAVFVQPQFSKRQAEVLAESLGLKVEVIDPLAEEWDKNILKVARTIGRYLE